MAALDHENAILVMSQACMDYDKWDSNMFHLLAMLLTLLHDYFAEILIMLCDLCADYKIIVGHFQPISLHAWQINFHFDWPHLSCAITE